MKFLLICFLIGSAMSAFISSNSSALGEKIVQNVTKLRHQQMETAYAASGITQNSETTTTTGITVREHVSHLRNITPRRCTHSHRILDTAVETYGANETSQAINLSITRLSQQVCN